MKRLIYCVKQFFCYVLISMLFASVVYAADKPAVAPVFYYYQGNQMSAINRSHQSTSFLLAGQDRVVTIPVASSDRLGVESGQYYLGDGKSHSLLFANALNKSLVTPATKQSVDYQGYGQSQQVLSDDVAQNFGYNGEYQDPVTHLSDLRARDYDALHQRFMSMDSYALWNRYAFANGDPIGNIDPTGHMSQNGMSLLVGLGVSVGITLARAFEGGADPSDIPLQRMAAKGLFIVGNTAPAALLAYHNFSQGQTTAGIGATLVAASGLAGTISAQPEIMLENAEWTRQAEARGVKNVLGVSISNWVTGSAIASQGLMALGSALQIQSGNTPAWRNPLVYAAAAAGLGAGGIYGFVSNKMFAEGESLSWAEMSWGNVAQKAAMGAVRSGFTGLLAAAPVDIYQAVHHEISAATLAESIALPFAMGMVSGTTQSALYGSETGFNGTFLMSSGARMAYLFVKPPLWSAITSGTLGGLFH